MNTSDGTVTILGSNGRKLVAAVEDTRLAITDDNFASHIVEAIENLDDAIADEMDDVICVENDRTVADNFGTALFYEDKDFSGINSGSNYSTLISVTQPIPFTSCYSNY